MVGLIKAVLALKHRQIPPSLHFNKPNPNIDFKNSPVYVNINLIDWEPDGSPRRCGVSAFGLSGTNSHIILEEAPVIQDNNDETGAQLFALSAKSSEVLKKLIEKYLNLTKSNEGINLGNLCYTVNTGRGSYSHRLGIITDSITDLRKKLDFLIETGLATYEEHRIFYNEVGATNSRNQEKNHSREAIATELTAVTNEMVVDLKNRDNDKINEVCRLYIQGFDVNWDDLYGKGEYRRLSLPTYPFEKRRCWIEIPSNIYTNYIGNAGASNAMEGQDDFKPCDITNRRVIIKGDGVDSITDTEKQIAQIWGEQLGFEEIDLNDNYYDIGGDSIIALNIVNQINKRLGINIDVTQLLSNQTIKDLSKQIDLMSIKNQECPFLEITPAPESEYYQLSSAQKRMFILSQYKNNGTGYNMPLAVKIDGPVDRRRFEESFKTLIERHEVFRTSFEFHRGEPVQKIHQEVDFAIDYLNFDETMINQAIADFIRPFELDKPPLLRISFVKLSESQHLLLMDMHHIIGDGMSLSILINEFIELYRGENLPELRIQYKDYVYWQNKYLTEKNIQKDRDYWANVLKDIPKLDMPMDFKRSYNSTSDGSRVKFIIEKEKKEELDFLSKRLGITLNTVLFSIYALLIHQYSNQNDLIIGTTVSGRQHADLKNIIGVFINFLPIRIKFNGKDTILEYIDTVKEIILNAYQHQNYPFEMMVENSRIKREPARNPIFDTMLIFHNENEFAALNTMTIDGVRFTNYEFVHNISKLDFQVDVYPTNHGEIICEFEYNTSLFRAETINLFINRFEKLIDQVLSQSNQKTAELELLTEAERDELDQKRRLNSTAKPIELAISATFTSEPVADYIKSWHQKFDNDIEVKFAPYNQVFQELLNQESLISRNKGLNLLMIRFEDWLRHDSLTAEDRITKLEQNYLNLVEILRNKEKLVPYLICCFPVSSHLKLGKEVLKYLETLNIRWLSELENMENVYVIDFGKLAELYNIENVFDQTTDEVGHLPFSNQYYDAMGTTIARKILSFIRQPFKVIALDCDNTLWSGICGEDGALEVEPYVQLQQWMLKKRNEGMLLVLCSKNNEEDVWEVFAKNEQMILKKEHIAAFRINWRPKSENIRELAAELNLGSDSFIFIDDNPVECAEMSVGCPEVLTLQLPTDKDLIPAFLEHVWPFDSKTTTEEDRNRTQMYHNEQKRREFQKASISMNDFLHGLELKMSMNPVKKEQLLRVSQLTQRTNQFNLSAIRRTERELESFIAGTGAVCYAVEVSDRFGDYGLVGVVIAYEKGLKLSIDTWLLSCRVLGRNIEEAILIGLGKYAKEKGYQTLEAKYYPTAKNGPFLEFIQRTGWKNVGEDTGWILFELEVSQILSKIDYIDCYYHGNYPKNNKAEKDVIRSVGLDHVGVEVSEPESTLRLPVTEVALRKEVKDVKDSLEMMIRQVWQDFLGKMEIGRRDNFYNLGGDSLKAVQVIAKMKNYGLTLEDMVQCPTIAGLAELILKRHSYAETNRLLSNHNIEGTEENKDEAQLTSTIHQEKRLVPVTRQAEQGIIRGEVGLLPIQRHFFGRDFTDKHHWNIPTSLIYTKGKIDETALRKAIHKVVEHHDSLRIVFQFEGGSVRQYIRGLDEGELYNLIVVDLSDETNYLKQIKKEVKEIHSSMDLAKGPLFKVGLFKTKDGNHLLIAVHHLVADGVSMEFIMKDLISGYYQVLNGREIQLPPKTDSLMDWSKAIYQYANSPQLKEEFKYWKSIIETEIPPFPKDNNTVRNRIRDSRYYRTTLLREEETSQLLKASRQSSHDLKTLLLTGLGYAFKEWSGYTKIPVTLLAHGRESVIGDLDITRTAGWISVGYPIIIEMISDNDISLQANHLRETLTKIPDNGIGHDILRYITFPDNGWPLDYKLIPEIIFNFIGQSGQEKNDNSSPFTVSPIAASMKTAHITGNQDRDYTFDFVISITGNALQIQLNYNKYQYQESTIENIVDGYRKNLQKIIENYLTGNNSNIGGETDIKINLIANQPVNEEEGLHREESPVDTDITNSIETVIRQVWRDVLGIIEIKRHDDFYDLGGDSLKAVQVIAKMKNYRLTLEDLIRYPTVAGLAEFTSKRHSYIEPEKLPPHLEKNLEIEYFFTENGSIDPLAKNMDCSTMIFYYNLKRYFPNCTDYLLVFFNDISFILTINPEGVLYNIDVNSFSDINDLYQADVRKGEGFQAISAIEELLDQGKLPIIKTYTKKLPFHKNFISFDFEVTDTPEDLAKDAHTFMAVAYDPQMLYYVEMPYVLNSNFIPYAKNKSVGVVKKDDLKHAFNVEIYYATIDIKVEKLNREISLKEKISLITSNSAQSVQNKEGYTIYSGLDALDALMTICRNETLFLNQENLYYNGFNIKKLFDWKLWTIISRRLQLKEILISQNDKHPNIKKYEILGTLDALIQAWRDLIGFISEKYERKEYLFGKEYLKNLETIKEGERKLLQKLSVI
jgi:FkbH-like protein/non-ribosomal peptide synthase protein (TIGR01720 family)